MGLEVTTTIAGLDATWPVVGDNVSSGDDHLRLIKAVLKATFPGAGAAGFATPITASEAEINYLVGVSSAVQTQLNAKAPIASPTFTGVPAAPTAALNTNTTQLATTEFVLNQASDATPLSIGTAAAGTNESYSRADHVHDATIPALSLQVFTSSGTYTKPATMKQGALVFVTGGGGSGAYGTSNFKSGGGGGGTAIKWIPEASIGATETVTIGSGGAGQSTSGNNGNDGGTSSFGAHCSASGGSKGFYATTITAGGAGGVGSGGDFNIAGNAGVSGGATTSGFTGGGSFWGGAQAGNSFSTVGTHGGGSGSSDDATLGSRNAGDGVCFILEF